MVSSENNSFSGNNTNADIIQNTFESCWNNTSSEMIENGQCWSFDSQLMFQFFIYVCMIIIFETNSILTINNRIQIKDTFFFKTHTKHSNQLCSKLFGLQYFKYLYLPNLPNKIILIFLRRCGFKIVEQNGRNREKATICYILQPLCYHPILYLQSFLHFHMDGDLQDMEV